MKTTIEINDSLFKEAKKIMFNENKTMRELVETSLRNYLDAHQKPSKPFKWKNKACKGDGLVDPSLEGDWPRIRELIYEGRGG